MKNGVSAHHTTKIMRRLWHES